MNSKKRLLEGSLKKKEKKKVYHKYYIQPVNIFKDKYSSLQCIRESLSNLSEKNRKHFWNMNQKLIIRRHQISFSSWILNHHNVWYDQSSDHWIVFQYGPYSGGLRRWKWTLLKYHWTDINGWSHHTLTMSLSDVYTLHKDDIYRQC